MGLRQDDRFPSRHLLGRVLQTENDDQRVRAAVDYVLDVGTHRLHTRDLVPELGDDLAHEREEVGRVVDDRDACHGCGR